jgi:peptide/nickel transport system permease protein
VEQIKHTDNQPSTGNRQLRRMLLNPKGFVGAIIVLAFMVTAIFAPALAPYDPTKTNVPRRLEAPSADYRLGTDELGRDVLSRVIHGTRISLLVGVVAVLLAMGIGVTLGALAGYFGGWLDDLIMRGVDIFLAIPTIVLAIGLVAVLGSSLFNVIMALGITSWPVYARVVRGQFLSLKHRDYVEAARASGATNSRIILWHILPNSISPIIVMATLQMATVIVAEASLSFLGLGVQPPTPSWGAMLSTGRRFLQVAFHTAIYPGLAITLTVLGFNLFGDSLRDALDPRLRGH